MKRKAMIVATVFFLMLQIILPASMFGAIWPQYDQHNSEIIFIDTSTPDYSTLVNHILPGTRVVFIGEEDGIKKMATILKDTPPLNAIYIISHGAPGHVYLGNASLSSETFNQYTTELSTIASSLTKNGDILLYGCDIAASETGRVFVDQLAKVSGADIAASDDPTGSANLGGDWKLEYRTGPIEAKAPFNWFLLKSYPALLDVFNETFDSQPSGLPSSSRVGSFAMNLGGTTFDFNGQISMRYVSDTQMLRASGTGGADGMSGYLQISRRDGGKFRFNSLYFSTPLSGTKYVTGYLNGETVYSAATGTLGSTFSTNKIVDRITISASYLDIDFDNFNGEIDDTPPNPPMIYVTDDTGTSSTDGITNDQTLVVNGTAEADSTVEVFFDGTSLSTVTTDGSGNWSIDYTDVTLEPGNYTITATATDDFDNVSDIGELTVTIDTTPPGEVMVTDELSVAENSTNGTVVGTVSSNGADVYTLVDDAGERFAINPTTGEVSVADGGLLDYEANSSHQITVRAADLAGNLADDTTFTVTVENVNEAPVIDLNGGDEAGIDYTVKYRTVDYEIPIADTDSTIEDIDISDNIESLIATFTATPNGENEYLSLSPSAQAEADTAGLSVNYDATKNKLTISGSASPDIYKSILKGINYTNDASPSEITTDTRELSLTVSDGTAQSIIARSTIDVVPVPIIFLNEDDSTTRTMNYIENAGFISLLDTAHIMNPFNVYIKEMMIQLSNPLDGYAEGILLSGGVASRGNIFVTYLSNSQIRLTGITTSNNYENLIRELQYNNISDDPNTTPRVISLTLTTINGDTGTPANMTLSIIAVNDLPSLINRTEFTLEEGTSYTLDNTGWQLTDLDNEATEITYTLQVIPEHGTLTLNGSQLNAGDIFNLADLDAGNLVYVQDGSEVLTDSFTLSVTDGIGPSLTGITASITINPVNDAPALVTNLPDQTAYIGRNFNYSIPEGTFMDEEGNAFTLSATLADGSSLPEWLSFDSDTYTFSGKPSNTDNGTLNIKVITTDEFGAASSHTFTMVVKTPPSSHPTNVVTIEDHSVEIKTQPKLDSQGIATSHLDDHTIRRALHFATAISDNSNTIHITIPEVRNATGYTVDMPWNTLASTQENPSLKIITSLGTITTPSNMLSNLTDQGKTAGITIAMGDKSQLNQETQEKIGDRPLIELSLTVDGTQQAWNNPDAPVTVSIPYTPTKEELKNPEHIVVWYIDGEGNVVSVPSGRYDPETETVTFHTTHFSKYAISYVDKTFSDISNYKWAKHQIETLASKGIINGTTKNSFSPKQAISRADYLVLLVRTLGLEASVNENFQDVAQGSYYYHAVGVAKELGITNGDGKNHFQPNASITRQDMMVLTARALIVSDIFNDESINAELDTFTDKSSISTYAENSIAKLVKEKLIQGSNGKINPLQNTTRAEAAVFLYRIYNKARLIFATHLSTTSIFFLARR